MAEENVDVVRRGFEAALREDWPGALGHAPLKGWGEGWETWGVEDAEFRAAGEMRDGLIVRQEYFNYQARALETVRRAA